MAEIGVLRRIGTDKPFPRSGIGRKGICKFWLSGKCNRNPCQFAHGQVQSPVINSNHNKVWRRDSGIKTVVDKSSVSTTDLKISRVSEKPSSKRTIVEASDGVKEDETETETETESYPLFNGDGISMVAKLQGHDHAVSDVELPVGSNKLFSCARDGTLMLWDCESGKLSQSYNLGVEIGSMISVGTWVFVGMPNCVKALNFKLCFDMNLSGPVGQVYAMAVARDMLFAGGQDGTIFMWKEGDNESNLFQSIGCMKGHTKAVVCMTAIGNCLYSGSIDNTIRVWDIDSLECVQTLVGHSDVVMSLLGWGQYLLSCSLDNTVKIWAVDGEGDQMKVTYTHKEESGVIKLHGMNDEEGKSVLFCSCNDNSVRLYELPSFAERGRISAKEEVRAIKNGPDGLFFTGDATGLVTVWKWMKKSEPSSSGSL